MNGKRQVFHALQNNAIDCRIEKIKRKQRAIKCKIMIAKRIRTGKRKVFTLLVEYLRVCRDEKLRYEMHVNKALRYISSKEIFKLRNVIQQWNRHTRERKSFSRARDRGHKMAMKKFQTKIAASMQNSFTKWHRFTKKIRSGYNVAMKKFENSVAYSKSDSFRKWVKYIHDLRVRKVIENSQMRAVLEMVKQQNSGVCRRAIAKWHRYILSRKLQNKSVSHREARMLDMMANLLAKGKRRILHRWHSTAVKARAERMDDAHTMAKIQHAVSKATKLFRSREFRALSRSFTKWTNSASKDRTIEDRQRMACRKVIAAVRSVLKRRQNNAFIRLCRNAHLTAHNADRVHHGFRTCVSILQKRELRLCASALRTWQINAVSMSKEEQRIYHAKVSAAYFLPLL